MRNERLRRAMLAQGLSAERLAERAGASVKSVRRWLDGVSVPYPKSRYQVAAIVREDDGKELARLTTRWVAREG